MNVQKTKSETKKNGETKCDAEITKIEETSKVRVQEFNDSDSKTLPRKLLLYFDKKGTRLGESDNDVIKWLKTTNNYTQYINLYNRIYQKSKIKQLECEKKSKQERIDANIIQVLSVQTKDNGYIEKYNFVCDTLQDYKSNITKRTKKTKEQYNIIVENLGILVCEFGINFHTWLGYKFDVNINIQLGLLDVTDSTVVSSEINNDILDFLELVDNIELEETYTKNISRNLDKELSKYIVRPIEVVSKNTGVNWSKLSKEIQLECFMEFAKMYTVKYNKGDHTKLGKQLIEWFENSTLVYRNIKWDKTKGTIIDIRGLVYDNTMDFYLLKKQSSISRTSASVSTSFDKIKLNNELLGYILSMKKRYGTLNEIKFDKNHFFGYIKKRFEVTLGRELKEELLSKLDTMYNCLLSQ